MTQQASETPKVYVVNAGRHGEDEHLALEHGIAIYGFKEIPPFKSGMDFEQLKAMVAEALPTVKPNAVPIYAGQIRTFVTTMAEGDFVVLPRKRTPYIAIGTCTGPYEYRQVDGVFRHIRPVKWLQTDILRSNFKQDLLYKLGAFLTVFRVQGNDAEQRIAVASERRADPGPALSPDLDPQASDLEGASARLNLADAAHNDIVANIQAQYKGHALAHLVAAVLEVDGWKTTVMPPGPDGGVDILAGHGPLGLDEPRLCAQVKSQDRTLDVNVYRELHGTMQARKAHQGLLVGWGGFTKPTIDAAKNEPFTIRLWDSADLVDNIYRTYQRLPAEIRAELPLKQVWMMATEEQNP